jgi:hypothetical protein
MVFTIFDNFLMNIHKSQLISADYFGAEGYQRFDPEPPGANREEGALDDRYCSVTFATKDFQSHPIAPKCYSI